VSPRRALAIVSLLGFLVACDLGNILCTGGSTCTSSNVSGPSAVPSPAPSQQTTPTPSPSPTASPADLVPCTPQVKHFVCLPSAPTMLPIVSAAQSKLTWAPEGIYVAQLVAELNKDPRVCAVGGFPLPSDEISVKYRDNSLSENFDVVNADGSIQAIPAGPVSGNGPANACQPARF